MSHATRMTLAIMLMVVLLASGLLIEYGLLAHVITQNNGHWCDTLNLLTSKPIAKPTAPGANPSREGQYQLYQNFVKLRTDFGCK